MSSYLKYRCCNESYCSSSFSTKKARMEHELTCQPMEIESEENGIDILPLTELQSIQLSNQNSHNNQVVISHNDESFNSEEMIFVALRAKLKILINTISQITRNQIELFYSHGVPLSGMDFVVQYPEKGVGLQVYIPKLLENKHRRNEARNVQKRIQYQVSKRVRLVKRYKIKSNSYKCKNKMISRDMILSFRPFLNLFLSFVFDDDFLGLGRYLHVPRKLSSKFLAGSYSQSPQYERMYQNMCAHFGREVIPVPFLFFSDASSFYSLSKNGNATIITLIPLLVSTYQAALKSRGTRLVGFSHQIKSNDDKVKPSVNSVMNVEMKAKCLEIIFKDIFQLSMKGVNTKRGFFVPYIAAVCCDIVELRLLFGKHNCPVCDSHLTKDVPTFDPNGQHHRYERFGVGLSNEDKQKAIQIRKINSNENANCVREMCKFAKTNGRKLVVTAFDSLKYPIYFGNERICIYIDRLHCLVLNEIKHILEHTFNNVDHTCFNQLIERSKMVKYFPTGLIEKKISGSTGSDIVKGLYLLISILYHPEVKVGYKKMSDFIVAMEMLECFAIIALVSSKELITKVGNGENVSDFQLLKDCFDYLLNSDYYKEVQRVNVHMLFMHFADFTMWTDVCAPRHISTSYGESFISTVKISLRSSNKGKFWTQGVLEKFATSDILLPLMNKESTTSCFVDPLYKKVIKISESSILIGYIDVNRNNLLVTNKCVKFTKYTSKSPHYCVVANRTHQHMLIDDFEYQNNIELDVYHLLDDTHVSIIGRVLGDIDSASLDDFRGDSRGIPHPNLYCYLSPSIASSIWNIDEVIGGCYHFQELDGRIFVISNHEFSHIITGRASVICEPDQRFISHLSDDNDEE